MSFLRTNCARKKELGNYKELWNQVTNYGTKRQGVEIRRIVESGILEIRNRVVYGHLGIGTKSGIKHGTKNKNQISLESGIMEFQTCGKGNFRLLSHRCKTWNTINGPRNHETWNLESWNFGNAEWETLELWI